MGSSIPENPAALLIVPGDLQRLTGGSLYDRKLADELSERGFRLDVVTVPDLPYFVGLIAGSVLSLPVLFRLARFHYDVIIEDGWAHPSMLLFNLVCKITRRAPLVVIVHQARWRTVPRFARSIARIAEGFCLRAADLIIAVSRFIGREAKLLGVNRDHILIAPPGSAPPTIKARDIELPSETIRLLFVGNCTQLKGLHYLIEALAMLSDISLTLDIVGDPDLEPRYYRRLLAEAKASNVVERIKFHGAVSHDSLGDHYSRADIFTFPSLYEGFGIVLAEAMHAGLPIVATRIGTASEIVREGENAIIVPLRNSAALAGAIRRLATDATMRETFGRRSAELALALPAWKQTCDSICDRIEIMSRTTPGKKKSMKATPTQSP